MDLRTSESIGTLRADLRRVELTMGARIGASESALRDEIDRIGQDLDRLSADIREQMDGIRGEVQRALEMIAAILHATAATCRSVTHGRPEGL